ncbi:hypothetical protein [Streptomyces sp. SCUT-3]|uniref:hypothetical protein n=1 Tax=Streptomyces sp. SCUT-3 TaxID=2684469 RepID=UPI002175506D|nr:hypothetical protein [Streptomyces sp. SCUT-3]
MVSGRAGMREVWSLPEADVRAGRRALWWSVGPEGELAVLLVHRRYLRRGGARGWVGLRPRGPFDGELVTLTAPGKQRTPLNGIRENPGHLALLPGGRLLLAGGRCRRGEADGAWEPNAVVYSAEGKPTGAFCIGDDVPVLVTDRSGGIWTAYGDEGIYGSHPESRAGLAGWDSDGRVTWRPRGRLPDRPLQGCTAATDGDRVWLVWYSGTGSGTFLTRITPSTGEVVSRPGPVHAPDEFAVRGNRAVMAVRNHNRPSVELVRAESDGAGWAVTDRRAVRLPGRVVMHCGQGRDGFLWLRAGNTFLRTRA